MTPVPYSLFVRFLITKGYATLDDLNAQLGELSLAPVDAGLFEAESSLVFSAVSPGVSGQILKRNYSADFPQAMKVLCVWDLWRYEKAFQGAPGDPWRGVVKLAYDIHHDPSLRLTINALLMKGVPPLDIAQTVNMRYAALLRDDHILLYEKFFFQARAMTRAAWKRYLKKCDGPEKKVYFLTLNHSLDEVKTALDLPANHSTTETLQYLLTKSTMRAKRLLDDETPTGRAEAMKWIDTVLKLTDKYEKYRAGDQTDLAKTLQMEFDFINTEFPAAGSELIEEQQAKAKKSGDEEEAAKAAESAQEEP